VSAPAAAHCGPDCDTCAPLAAQVAELSARVEALSFFTTRVYAITGTPLPAAVGENIPARPSLTVLPGGAA
jgi:hypothetical protein